ncbi:hypothetical protein [Crocosphaera watsonii]
MSLNFSFLSLSGEVFSDGVVSGGGVGVNCSGGGSGVSVGDGEEAT